MVRKATKNSKLTDQKKLSYKDMVTSAIENLKDKSGSSRSDIVKYISANNDIGNASVKEVEIEIKKGLKSGYILSCSKGKSRTRLFTLNTSKRNGKNDQANKGKTENESPKQTSEKSKQKDEEAPSTSDALTRAKLPIKVKEAKEKKRAEAMAKRAAKPKSTKKGRRKGKKRGNSSKTGTSNNTGRAKLSERAINAKILAAFEEIWKNM
ncbi:hypothetical protein ACF0H5_012728 [Mactra antiquata]